MGVLGGRPKWLVTITLHCDLFVTVYDTKHTPVCVFAMGAPPGLRVLGCSPSGEALASPGNTAQNP
jgi:hypothetical protein